MWAWRMRRSMSAAATIASPRFRSGFEAAVASDDDRAAFIAGARRARRADWRPGVRAAGSRFRQRRAAGGAPACEFIVQRVAVVRLLEAVDPLLGGGERRWPF